MEERFKQGIVLGLAILIIGGIGVWRLLEINTQPIPNLLEPLIPLPAASELPSNESFWTEHNNVSFSADVFYFPLRAHAGDHFELTLTLRVNNTNPDALLNFTAVKISVFTDDHSHFYTFGLLPSESVTISGVSTVTLTYTEDRDIESLDDLFTDFSGYLYSRIELSYEGVPSTIINSPTTLVFMAIE